MTGSPVLVDTHAARTASMAMATLPRNMHHHLNGNGGHPRGWNSPPPPPPPPHQSEVGSSATLPAKKKSVTIGTFTTVVEPFEISEEENMISSAV